MSNCARRSGNSFSVIASAWKRAASCAPRSSVRLATVIDFGALRREMRRRELDHLAGADQEHALLGDRREDALGELDRRGGHRNRRAADVGLRAHVLRHRERALEKPVQHQSQRTRRLGAAHGLLHLAENLRLAEHHRIESAGDAKRMLHRVVLRQRVDVRRQRRRVHAVKILEPLRNRCRLRAVEVHLGAVAGRQDRRFLDHWPA